MIDTLHGMQHHMCMPMGTLLGLQADPHGVHQLLASDKAMVLAQQFGQQSVFHFSRS